jgi:hypothetical protein
LKFKEPLEEVSSIRHSPRLRQKSPEQIISNIMSPITTELKSSLKQSSINSSHYKKSRRDLRRELKEALEPSSNLYQETTILESERGKHRPQPSDDTLARGSSSGIPTTREGRVFEPHRDITCPEKVGLSHRAVPQNTIMEQKDPKAIKNIDEGVATMVNTVVKATETIKVDTAQFVGEEQTVR